MKGYDPSCYLCIVLGQSYYVIFIIVTVNLTSGPYDIECLRIWWQDNGCSLNGEGSPDNNSNAVYYWNSISPDAVNDDMHAYYENAGSNLDSYPSLCWGPGM